MIKIKKNSAIYKLASFGGIYEWEWEYGVDSCQLTKALTLGAVKILGILIIVLPVMFMWVSTVLVSALAIFYGWGNALSIPYFGHVGAYGLFFSFIGSIIIVVVAIAKASEIRRTKYKPKKPSTMAKLWDSFRNKYCVKVELE